MSEEEKKLFDITTATGYEIIKATVDDKIANFCTLNKEQCQEILNLIEKQQKEIEQYAKFVLDMKEKMNNFQFEAETGWRKIEKLEKKIGGKDE